MRFFIAFKHKVSEEAGVFSRVTKLLTALVGRGAAFHVDIGFGAIETPEHEFVGYLKGKTKKALGAPVIKIFKFYLSIASRTLVNGNLLVKYGI